MKTSKKLDNLVNQYVDKKNDLEITSYELRKLRSRSFKGFSFILKKLEVKILAYHLKLIKEAIDRENQRLGNAPIVDMDELLENHYSYTTIYL